MTTTLMTPTRVIVCCLTLLMIEGRLRAQSVSPNRNTPLVRAIQRVRPAVINIHSQKSAAAPDRLNGPFGSANYKMNGMGTGIVVDERGYIVTNYHVIEDVSAISVTLVDGATHTAEVIARDPETDLALLKINPSASLPVISMGTSADLMHGEPVFAIGNAFGYEHTVTSGIISQLHRDVRLSAEQAYRDLIQTDASINPGNSGGPLLNADGEMVGLNVAIRAGAQGIGFAIPVDEVKRVTAKLMSVRSLKNTWHGIVCATPASMSTSGRVVVQHIEPGSPAQLAGIRPGDRLVAVGERKLNYAFDVERALLDKRPLDKVNVVLSRGEREEQVTLLLKSASESDDPVSYVRRRLGMTLAQGPSVSELKRVSSQLRGGLEISDLVDGGPAARSGLQVGDVLVGLHQWETLSPENVVYVLTKQHRPENNPLRFFVVRGGQIQRGLIDIPTE